MPLDLNRPAGRKSQGCRRCGAPITVRVTLEARLARTGSGSGHSVGSATGSLCSPCAVAVFDACEPIVLATEKG